MPEPAVKIAEPAVKIAEPAVKDGPRPARRENEL